MDIRENFKKDNEGKGSAKSKFLGIHFTCCNTYGRLYKNKAGTAYIGMCPSCGKRASVPIGEGGTNARFFSAT